MRSFYFGLQGRSNAVIDWQKLSDRVKRTRAASTRSADGIISSRGPSDPRDRLT